MKKKKCSLSMVIYELRNINGNFMPHFFGFIFPNLMCVLLSETVGNQVPEEMRTEVCTGIMLSMTLVMPMAIMLLGYACLYSIEVEKGIPLRMRLFGYKEQSVILAKIIAHLIFLTIAFLIFGIFQLTVMDIEKPSFSSLLILLACLYLTGIIFLVIAHAIANLFQKFSLTFGVAIFFYFIIMILCGMMGIRTEQLPSALQKLARTLPMTYISNDFIDFWTSPVQDGAYHFMPLIQSFLFFGAIAGILLLASLYRNKRLLR